jgi:hypothetical protein
MTKMKDGRSSLRKGSQPSRGARKNRRAVIEVNPISQTLWEIMGRFAQAISVVVVCHRSLAAQSSAAVGDEEETLRWAIRLLKDVYNEVDLASLATTKTQPPPSSTPTHQTAVSPVR